MRRKPPSTLGHLVTTSRPFYSSLRARLFVGLLPLVAMFLLMGVGAVTLFSRLAGSVNQAVTENYRSIMAVHSISLLLVDLERDFSGTGSTRNGSTNLFAQRTLDLEQNLAALSKRTPLPGERDLVLQLMAEYTDLHKVIAAPVTLSSPRMRTEPRESGIVLRVAEMNTVLGKIRNMNYEAILDANRNIQNSAREVSRMLTLGLAAVLVISVLSCYWIGRSILRPIQALTIATRELGDGNLRELVPVRTRDELGELAAAFNKMATLLQEYRRSTTEEIVRLHRTMEATLASFPDPVFVLNKQGSIELKNPAAISFSDSLQLADELPPRLQSLAQAALLNGQTFLPHSFDQGQAFRLNGVETFFLPRVIPMVNREGALFGVAVVLQDVTRFRLLDSAKTNLVATVSHEIKSPLTSVRMALYLLLEKTLGGLTSKQEELVQAARDDSERLLGILNDLLDLARLEEGAADLRREKIAPVELVHQVREEMAERAASKSISITCVMDPQLPTVSVDRQRIDLVLTNLMANAIKYSPDYGEITLRATRSDDKSGVLFSVTDHGKGIAEEYQGRIFDRFFRVPGQEKNGAGLGLSIAREITVAHGGRIGVRSAPGTGATFYVVLQAAE